MSTASIRRLLHLHEPLAAMIKKEKTTISAIVVQFTLKNVQFAMFYLI